MNCKKCGEEITEENIIITTNDDLEAFDIVIECNECGTALNGFMHLSDMIELES